MGAPHAGQRDAGHTTDWRRGTRWITTFRKLPAMSPSRPDTSTIKAFPPTVPFATPRLCEESRAETPSLPTARHSTSSQEERVAHRAQVGFFAGPDPLGLDALVEQHSATRDRAESLLSGEPDEPCLFAWPVDRVADRRVRPKAAGRHRQRIVVLHPKVGRVDDHVGAPSRPMRIG